jgi:molybdate transport system substrate-binding protein
MRSAVPVTRRLLTGLALSAAFLPAGAAVAQIGDVVVFAAASLKNALDEIVGGWRGSRSVKISYAASSALARQIEAGAPADVFISADLDWMDYVDQRKLIRTDSRVNLLGNRIVLIAPKDSQAKAEIAPGFPLRGLLGDGRLAMANVDAVPAGKYGKAALTALGVWPSVQDRLAQAENVRAALLLVARGEAPLGIVYQTDAAADPAVRVLGAFPESTHPPILYPAAITARATNPAATALLQQLRSPEAAAIFEKHGFSVPR